MENMGLTLTSLSRFNKDFWRGRRVLITGHTGFKGAWLSLWLQRVGAEVHSLALTPSTTPALFDQLQLGEDMVSTLGDIRDRAVVDAAVAACKPEVLFHLAAQPLVGRSYVDPIETWSTNVMGTANILESLRARNQSCAVIVVTTDKVYANREWDFAYREVDPLGGHDPYSASKAGTELVVESYRKSFFAGTGVRLATARAGNVIGGGDWAAQRIIPDLVRAFSSGRPLDIRNPDAVRPWQHVLDPLHGYLILAQQLVTSVSPIWEDAFNFGPEAQDQRRVGDLVDAARLHWPGEIRLHNVEGAPHEAQRLSLSIERARNTLGWTPRWSFAQAVAATIDWYRKVDTGATPRVLTELQMDVFEASA